MITITTTGTECAINIKWEGNKAKLTGMLDLFAESLHSVSAFNPDSSKDFSLYSTAEKLAIVEKYLKQVLVERAHSYKLEKASKEATSNLSRDEF